MKDGRDLCPRSGAGYLSFLLRFPQSGANSAGIDFLDFCLNQAIDSWRWLGGVGGIGGMHPRGSSGVGPRIPSSMDGHRKECRSLPEWSISFKLQAKGECPQRFQYWTVEECFQMFLW